MAGEIATTLVTKKPTLVDGAVLIDANIPQFFTPAYHRLTWPSTIPVHVIVSAQTPMPAGSPDADQWRSAQQEFASAAPNRTLVTAENSSHDVAVDRPDVVIEQMTDLLADLSPSSIESPGR